MSKNLNEFTIKDNYVEIKLNSTKHPGKFAIVDLQDFPKIRNYTWVVAYTRPNFFTALTKIKKKIVYMHQLIYPGKRVSRIQVNKNLLDNRRINLIPYDREN